ncbi:MAG: sulfur carrier protein ThiS [Gammaproteobacteria bacterium]|nr:sulfur carrier protein ThiS [Gammaproteobacteria bacterium]
MEIQLNGEPKQVAPGSTIADLVSAEGLANRRVAVEVNLEIVPRSQYDRTAIAAGDRIEIVHAIGGGQETS